MEAYYRSNPEDFSLRIYKSDSDLAKTRMQVLKNHKHVFITNFS